MKKLLLVLPTILLMTCRSESSRKNFDQENGEVKLVILEPGHFHAALAQKNMMPQVNKDVYVYAPKGEELTSYLSFIEGYNNRVENPTAWNEIVYSEDDYFDKMLKEKRGNVVVLAGNNKNKINYINKSIAKGFNVLSDKPMIINKESFSLLEESFNNANKQSTILYDMMTERYDVTNAIQKILMLEKELFGDLTKGSVEEPAIESKSVHHFLKFVSGNPLIRPSWYYDTEQQGDGITDVTTHLIDQIMWKCFDNQVINYKRDIKVNDANRWPTKITLKDFQTSTNCVSFPSFLDKDIVNDTLNVYSNGNMQFEINGVQVRVEVVWNVQAPEGTGDRHRFLVKGTKADLYILQGEKENFKPKLYIKKKSDLSDNAFRNILDDVIDRLQPSFPGVSVSEAYDDMLLIDIPDELNLGHESHFQKVIEKFIDYMIEGKQPDWEIANTLSKYYITTEALNMAKRKTDSDGHHK